MAAKGGLGKSFKQIQADAEKTHDHPVTAAIAFAASTSATGGATMNARSGRLLRPGTPGYVVGGEPDTQGNRIPTTYHDEKGFGLHTILSERSRIRQQTGGRPRVNVGSWKDNGQVEVDASGTYDSRRAARDRGNRRGEKAIWDNGNSDEIRLKAGQAKAWDGQPTRRPEGFGTGQATQFDHAKGSKRVTNLGGTDMERWQRLSGVTGRNARTLKKRG